MYIDENGLAEFTRKMKEYIDNKFAPTPQEEYFLTFSSPNSFTLSVVDNQKYWDGTLETSTDKTNWTTWDGTSAVSSASDGTNHNIFVRGIGNTYITGSSASLNTARWKFTGSSISINGNIENLLDYQTVIQGNHPAMAFRCFAYMFSENYPQLENVSQSLLPFTTLSQYCFAYMFYNTSIANAPSLPAITAEFGSYQYMFCACVNITEPPKISATTLRTSCCEHMFDTCSGLTKLPKIHALTIDTYACRSMFNYCSLIKISTTQTGEYVNEYRIPYTGTGVVATSSLNNMFRQTGGTFTGTPTSNTTYYTSNDVV